MSWTEHQAGGVRLLQATVSVHSSDAVCLDRITEPGVAGSFEDSRKLGKPLSDGILWGENANQPADRNVGPTEAPRLSIVVPIFNEQENILELYRRLTEALAALGQPYELVLVDDGSRDASPVLLDGLACTDAHVVVMHLSRNFGHQAAVCAGLERARGDAVVVMDGDLQDPPEVLGQFVEKWQEGFEVVYAVRTKRKESRLKRAGYFLFYRLLRKVSDLDIPLDSGDFCLMDRKVVEAIKELPERGRFVRGLRTFVGFRQTGLCYERAAREAGKPKYSLRSLVRLAMDGLISFSNAPLNLVTYLGFASAFIALGLTLWVMLDALITHTAPAGWASTVVVVLFMGSVQLVSLGILGEYVRRIFLEVKGRPTYIVRDVVQQRRDPAHARPTHGAA
ncbi:MAG: glycosyltransferase family 2 protein [Gemmataceae bacterium]|nr:glycosyltransferase family 2 protein [Gemmataceae bacterium]